jgi:metal-sulfur cluster biosynthetic enzyme
MNTQTIALTEARVLDCLRQVIDPEIGCNIVDLGLVYDVRIAPGRVDIQMTLTTPGCPMHETILEGVRRVLLSIPGVAQAEVNLVWDPPWHPSLMSSEARELVGGRF